MDMFAAKTLTPMLFHKRVDPFNDPKYLYELKLDGIRCLAYLDESGAELRTKENKPLLPRFPEMSEIHRGVKKRCILDGELFIMRDGRPDFEAIQPRIVLSKKQRIEDAARRAPASYVHSIFSMPVIKLSLPCRL